MLVVILGAGASFDSNPRFPPGILDNIRPPLTADLFADRFDTAMARFPSCLPIVPYLRPAPDGSVEQVLQDLADEGRTDPARLGQILAVQYYLQLMVWSCQRDWVNRGGGLSNYLSLFDQIRHGSGENEPTLIVTFNYDLLIEDALRGLGARIDDLAGYISHPRFRLIKAHGSVNWARAVRAGIVDVSGLDYWGAANAVIASAGTLKIDEAFRLTDTSPPSTDGGQALVPAIAIPTVGKDQFLCPPDHRQMLIDSLPTVSRMIVVGWRGIDPELLALLARSTSKPIPALFALGPERHGHEAADRFRASGVQISALVFDGGFTQFVVSRKVEAFLRG